MDIVLVYQLVSIVSLACMTRDVPQCGHIIVYQLELVCQREGVRRSSRQLLEETKIQYQHVHIPSIPPKSSARHVSKHQIKASGEKPKSTSILRITNTHPHGHQQCPAKDETCNKCSRKRHFQNVYKAKRELSF